VRASFRVLLSEQAQTTLEEKINIQRQAAAKFITVLCMSLWCYHLWCHLHQLKRTLSSPLEGVLGEAAN
jgi:hypothetical protein